MMGYSIKNIKKSNDEDDALYVAIKIARPTLALDCGANKGVFAKKLRKAGYKGPIWCFEPNRDCVQLLNNLATADSNFRVFPIGTGSDKAEIELKVAGENGNMGSFLPRTALMEERFRNAHIRDQYLVAVNRLDDVLTSEGVSSTERILLKMDTQGYDCETFKGLGERVNQVFAVKVELSVRQIYEGAPPHWEMLDLLRQHDFEPISFSTVSRDFDGRIIEYDALFVKTEN